MKIVVAVVLLSLMCVFPPTALGATVEEENARYLAMVAERKDPARNCIVPLFSNRAWAEAALNAVMQLESVPGSSGLGTLVYAWDRATCELFAEKGRARQCYYNETLSDPRYSEGDSRWGSSGYFAMIDSRLSVVAWTMEHAGVDVLMLDTDAAILGDVMTSAYALDRDLVYQEEVPSTLNDVDVMPELNGGCWLAKNRPWVREWLRLSSYLMAAMGMPDQDAMNLALRRMAGSPGASHAALPRGAFPNGFLRYVARPPALEASPLVFAHANWISGLNGKFIRVFDEGGWRVEGRKTFGNASLARRPNVVFKLDPREAHAPFSFSQQVSRVKKLLRVARFFGGAIVMERVACRPYDATYLCGVDVLFDFASLERGFLVYPYTVDDALPADRVFRSPLTSASLPFSEEGEGGELRVVMLTGERATGYPELTTLLPLGSEEEERALESSAVLSGFLLNEVKLSLFYFKREPFLCVYDDPLLGVPPEELLGVVSRDYPGRDRRVYWVSSSPTRPPTQEEYARSRTFMSLWGPSGGYAGWDVLWHGASELKGHATLGYIQSLVCGFAERVYANTLESSFRSSVETSWFSERLCGNPPRCLFARA